MTAVLDIFPNKTLDAAKYSNSYYIHSLIAPT